MAIDEYRNASYKGNELMETSDSTLALRFVDSLRKKGVLDDVICSEDIDCVRVCENCGKLMNEGWVYEGIETYCSDDCMIASHPDVNIPKLKVHAIEDNSNSYWTMWEE